MIEGLRQVPWLQERMRNRPRDIEFLTDCDRCRGRRELTPLDRVGPLTVEQRQSWGCPYERPDPCVAVNAWTHPGYTSEAPTACPGYTSKLPEVAEVARARLHWSKGSLRDHCGEPSELLMRGIEILESAANEAQCWREDDKP